MKEHATRHKEIKGRAGSSRVYNCGALYKAFSRVWVYLYYMRAPSLSLCLYSFSLSLIITFRN